MTAFPTTRLLLCVLLLLGCGCHRRAQGQGQTKAAVPEGTWVMREVGYAGTENARQRLDLYLPEKAPAQGMRLPLVVFIHGGGWASGSKEDSSLPVLLALIQDHAFVGAAINYRLTKEAGHPAQIHDCKAAIRFLRQHAAEYHIDPEKIAVVGLSAGGHLASLLGTSGGVAELEGAAGDTAQSSRVACVVNFAGPADFLSFAAPGDKRMDPEDGKSAIGLLLGGKVSERQEVARAASPVTYISRDDPPFLHLHGTADETVPVAQSVAFDRALQAAGVSSTLLTAEGAGHAFFSPKVLGLMRAFLDEHLLGKPGTVKAGPFKVK